MAMKLFISTEKAVYGLADSKQDVADELLSLVYSKGIAPVFSGQHSFWTYPSDSDENSPEIDDAFVIAGFELHMEAR